MRNGKLQRVITIGAAIVCAASARASLPSWFSSIDVNPVIPGGPSLSIQVTLAGVWPDSAPPDLPAHSIQSTPSGLNIFLNVLRPNVENAAFVTTSWILEDTVASVSLPYSIYGQLWTYPPGLPQFATPLEFTPTLLFTSPAPEPGAALLLIPALLMLRRFR